MSDFDVFIYGRWNPTIDGDILCSRGVEPTPSRRLSTGEELILIESAETGKWYVTSLNTGEERAFLGFPGFNTRDEAWLFAQMVSHEGA